MASRNTLPSLPIASTSAKRFSFPLGKRYSSIKQDSPVETVAMEKEQKTVLVHQHRLGKGSRHAYKTGETLPQGSIPPLHMGGFSRFFSHGCMLLLRDRAHIDFQKICKAMALPTLLQNRFPQLLTRLFPSLSNGIGHHLACLAAQGNPNPRVVRFFEDKRPQFVQFQGRGSGIFGIRGEQGDV